MVRIKPARDVRLTWEGGLRREFPALSTIAGRLLALHATSCSTERMWSLLRWIYSDQRLLLATDKARMLLYIAVTKRLERRQQARGSGQYWWKCLKVAVHIAIQQLCWFAVRSMHSASATAAIHQLPLPCRPLAASG